MNIHVGTARRYQDVLTTIRTGSLPQDDASAHTIAAFRDTTEAVQTALGLDPFDTQLLAGLAIWDQQVIQMGTGEGKTLAAVFPAVAATRLGLRTHILTANDYLARRDASWMGPVYTALGIDVTWVTAALSVAERRQAYRGDVVYLTAQTAGFDILRDSVCYDTAEQVEPYADYAIIDEADFLLIDQARTPLVLAGPSNDGGADPVWIDTIVRRLQPHADFDADRRQRRCTLTLQGQRTAAALLQAGTMDDPEWMPLYAAVHCALHAHYLLRRDVDYVVRDGRVALIEDSTGRIDALRRWPYGIQGALEAKEGVAVRREGRVYGTMTIPSVIRLYSRRGGMTATAVPAATELFNVYGMSTVVVPPRCPPGTVHREDRVFGTVEAKKRAVVEEIRVAHKTGRPVLIGTRSVAESEELAKLLVKAEIPCQVLNAKDEEREAAVVARAGRRGAVTVATNMAGRGTDILLGDDAAEHDALCRLGGLYVIGTNHHESRRVDDQLRGRTGRQGDPGETCFFVSLEDELVTKFAILELIPTEPRTDALGEIHDRGTNREIDRGQEIIEAQHSAMRETLRRYSHLVERERQIKEEYRRCALVAHELPDEVWQAADRLPGTSLSEQTLIRAYLAAVDDGWAEHLELIETIREGIGLQRLGGRDPLLHFTAAVTDAFESYLQGLPTATTEKLRDPTLLGHTRFEVSSTWTYQVKDDPFPEFRVALAGSGDPVGQLMASIAAVFHTIGSWVSKIRLRRD